MPPCALTPTLPEFDVAQLPVSLKLTLSRAYPGAALIVSNINDVELLLCPPEDTLGTESKKRLPNVGPKNEFSKFAEKLPKLSLSLYVMLTAPVLITADWAAADASIKTAAQRCRRCRLMILTPVEVGNVPSRD